jgi:xanthosine utilization system XapX-like protein
MSTPPVGSTTEEKMAAKLRAQQSSQAAPPTISAAFGLLGMVLNNQVNAKLANLKKRFGL